MTLYFLLSAFGVALLVSLLASAVALRLFPWFRSGEKKAGNFRPDQSGGSGGHQVEVSAAAAKKGRAPRNKVRARSSELPLIGGAAMLLAILVASGVAGFLLNFTFGDWELLGLVMATMLGFGFIGLIDDILKVFRGKGVTEIQKFVGIIVVAFAAAFAFNRLLASSALSARLAYSPYRDLPLLGDVLVHVHYAWLIFFLLLTVTVTTTTALAVDFSDGMDGLSGGLLLSAALSYAIILLDEGVRDFWPLTIALLAMAGATLGFLPFNWPSSWRGGPHPSGKRRARLIMGDTGSLALGGLLAIVAIVSRLELLLVLIGGAFVLEGVSALISARILVGFFRRFLFVERFNSSRGFPHTEFPLPFLATPMHHHFELLAWDRKRLVYGAWVLGAGLGLLGIASVMGPFTWERYLARFVAFLLLLLIWQFGPWTRAFFVGLTPVKRNQPGVPRYLALYYGAPFKLFGWPLYARIDVTHATVDALDTAAERLSLWQLMNVFDARSLLGYYCFQARELDDALRIWDRIPQPNLDQRKEISSLVIAAKRLVAQEALNSQGSLARVVLDHTPPLTSIPSENETKVIRQTSGANGSSGSHAKPESGAAPMNYSTVAPGPTTRVSAPPASSGGRRTTGAPGAQGAQDAGAPTTKGAPLNSANADPSASAWRAMKPTTGIQPTPRLHPVDDAIAPDVTVTPAPPQHTQEPQASTEPVLWSVSAWVGANPQAVEPIEPHIEPHTSNVNEVDDVATMPRLAAHQPQAEPPKPGISAEPETASVGAGAPQEAAEPLATTSSETQETSGQANITPTTPTTPVTPVIVAMLEPPIPRAAGDDTSDTGDHKAVSQTEQPEASAGEAAETVDASAAETLAPLATEATVAEAPTSQTPDAPTAEESAPEEPPAPVIVPTLTPKASAQPGSQSESHDASYAPPTLENVLLDAQN